MCRTKSPLLVPKHYYVFFKKLLIQRTFNTFAICVNHNLTWVTITQIIKLKVAHFDLLPFCPIFAPIIVITGYTFIFTTFCRAQWEFQHWKYWKLWKKRIYALWFCQYLGTINIIFKIEFVCQVDILVENKVQAKYF